MKPTNIAAPDYFHKVVDCQWACPAHTPVPEYIRLIAEGRYTSPEQFEQIILRANADGTSVRLKDVARIELGPFRYGQRAVYNGDGVAGLGVQLVSGANALKVATAVKAEMADLQTRVVDS